MSSVSDFKSVISEKEPSLGATIGDSVIVEEDRYINVNTLGDVIRYIKLNCHLAPMRTCFSNMCIKHGLTNPEFASYMSGKKHCPSFKSCVTFKFRSWTFEAEGQGDTKKQSIENSLDKLVLELMDTYERECFVVKPKIVVPLDRDEWDAHCMQQHCRNDTYVCFNCCETIQAGIGHICINAHPGDEKQRTYFHQCARNQSNEDEDMSGLDNLKDEDSIPDILEVERPADFISDEICDGVREIFLNEGYSSPHSNDQLIEAARTVLEDKRVINKIEEMVSRSQTDRVGLGRRDLPNYAFDDHVCPVNFKYIQPAKDVGYSLYQIQFYRNQEWLQSDLIVVKDKISSRSKEEEKLRAISKDREISWDYAARSKIPTNFGVSLIPTRTSYRNARLNRVKILFEVWSQCIKRNLITAKNFLVKKSPFLTWLGAICCMISRKASIGVMLGYTGAQLLIEKTVDNYVQSEKQKVILDYAKLATAVCGTALVAYQAHKYIFGVTSCSNQAGDDVQEEIIDIILDDDIDVGKFLKNQNIQFAKSNGEGYDENVMLSKGAPGYWGRRSENRRVPLRYALYYCSSWTNTTYYFYDIHVDSVNIKDIMNYIHFLVGVDEPSQEADAQIITLIKRFNYDYSKPFSQMTKNVTSLVSTISSLFVGPGAQAGLFVFICNLIATEDSVILYQIGDKKVKRGSLEYNAHMDTLDLSEKILFITTNFLVSLKDSACEYFINLKNWCLENPDKAAAIIAGMVLMILVITLRKPIMVRVRRVLKSVFTGKQKRVKCNDQSKMCPTCPNTYYDTSGGYFCDCDYYIDDTKIVEVKPCEERENPVIVCGPDNLDHVKVKVNKKLEVRTPPVKVDKNVQQSDAKVIVPKTTSEQSKKEVSSISKETKLGEKHAWVADQVKSGKSWRNRNFARIVNRRYKGNDISDYNGDKDIDGEWPEDWYDPDLREDYMSEKAAKKGSKDYKAWEDAEYERVWGDPYSNHALTNEEIDAGLVKIRKGMWKSRSEGKDGKTDFRDNYPKKKELRISTLGEQNAWVSEKVKQTPAIREIIKREVTIDQANDIKNHPFDYKHNDAVVKIFRDGRDDFLGQGVLVCVNSKYYIVTALHVVKTTGCYFAVFPNGHRVPLDELVALDKIDMCYCRIDNSKLPTGVRPVKTFNKATKGAVASIPNKSMAIASGIVKGVDKDFVYYTCFTEAGDSGSPVFIDNQLVAIHKCSFDSQNTNGGIDINHFLDVVRSKNQ